MVFNRCGKLREMFDSPILIKCLKLRLYVTAVVLVMTYGCESWMVSHPGSYGKTQRCEKQDAGAHYGDEHTGWGKVRDSILRSGEGCKAV